ncbi:MAG TPA: LemA family protein [Candidatus Sulfotelmatobacter sp.]|nr:LemA family protein [Candidatus Sulfotelmatobacter sp.]
MDIPIVVIAFILAFVLFLVWMIVAFNGLVRMRNRVRNGWSDIDVQLARRHDLVPNLVETAKGYMQHERSVLDEVTQARSQAVVPTANIPQRALAEASLTGALSRFFVQVENYPNLRAAENMQLLQEQLTSTENRIAFARQHYNDEVMNYNTARLSFPRNILAGIFGLAPATMFAADPNDRERVEVQLSSSSRP